MKERQNRLKVIKNIIKNNRIESQDELQAKLLEQGFEVTQATLSRDLKLLKVAKVSDGKVGYMYAVSDEETTSESEQIYVQDFLRGYVSIGYSKNIVVIKTFSGHANTVCNAIDNLNFEEILGTVAGDNCMFACLKEDVSAKEFIEILKRRIPGIDE
jgi:transcriptional regulator of arginine metabolism